MPVVRLVRLLLGDGYQRLEPLVLEALRQAMVGLQFRIWPNYVPLTNLPG